VAPANSRRGSRYCQQGPISRRQIAERGLGRVADKAVPPVGAVMTAGLHEVKERKWAGSVGFSPCASFSFYSPFPFSDLYFPISFEFKFHT
jgi:hypothetical protein